MPDYGHDLVLGTFLTPAAKNPQQVVALAQTTERAGLDLVTFQDHPYQPAFLDTWTLLSWVAASTDRVQVAGQRAQPPAAPARRPRARGREPRPALGRPVRARPRLRGVLGRDRRDGRPAPHAGRASTRSTRPSTSSAASGTRTSASRCASTGRYHRVDGAKRGPAPAHDIPIWLGAYKPRMLGLVGRKADGWLPSLGYLKHGDLAAGNARIDESAQAAGRDPREIRRLLNLGGGSFSGAGFLQGPPERWVEDLLPLVLEDGISTFILGSDDAGDDRAVRRGGRPCAARAPSRPSARLGRDRDGHGPARRPPWPSGGPASTTTALPASLAATAVEPGDREYGRVRSSYVYAGSPGLVLRPRRRRGGRATRSPSRARRTCRSRCAAAGTGSAAGRRTTAASSSTSARSTPSRCSTASSASSASVRARAGATSRPRCRRTAWRSAPATTATSASAGS